MLQIAYVQKLCRIASDVRDFVIAAVLLKEVFQQDDWHPVAYCSQKLLNDEQNYTAAERETLAVVFALKSWRIYIFQHFDVFIDSMAHST